MRSQQIDEVITPAPRGGAVILSKFFELRGNRGPWQAKQSFNPVLQPKQPNGGNGGSMPGLTRRAAIALSGAALFASRAGADTGYPTRPVRTVVPFPPGGTTDVIGRIAADGLGTELGQQFYIDNRGGAGGTLGADAVAKSKPDGYSLLVFHSGLTYGPALFKHLNYDVLKDFTPISLLGVAPSVLVITPS